MPGKLKIKGKGSVNSLIIGTELRAQGSGWGSARRRRRTDPAKRESSPKANPDIPKN